MIHKSHDDRTVSSPFVAARVEAYAGYRANERPMAFYRGEERLRVVEILDRWYQGGISPRDQKLDYFKVLADDGREYILRYDALFDTWSLLER